MKTSAEQLHHGQFNPEPQKVSDGQNEQNWNDERLFIDLDICAGHQCPECSVQCSYHSHFNNNGIRSVIELATYALVCRRCDDPHCVLACPVGALEQQKDKGALLVRHNMLCISCHSCSLACPYGTIYPDHVPLLIHNCDFCFDRRAEHNQPLCVQTCPYGALSLRRSDSELDDNTFLVGEHLIVHSTHWESDKA